MMAASALRLCRQRRLQLHLFSVRSILPDTMKLLTLDLQLYIHSIINMHGGSRHFSSSQSVPKLDLTDLSVWFLNTKHFNFSHCLVFCFKRRKGKHTSNPHTWYPNARKKKRSVIMHVGPTNSGKTYHALKRLESSTSGVYCGPLRLLAWEVAQRLNKANVPCNLITGQEREEIDGAKHTAVTVEMVEVTCEYQCAVIDEIQMMGCKTRGYSFTRALLGICSDELHLCGDAAAVPLIQEILEATGDAIKVEYYDRLLPLIPSNIPLGSFANIRTGDCVVTFSRHQIYRIKKEIEKRGTHLCSVVYGSLPPQTRTRQATMFNDEGSELDVLVASDAVGMGLNLNISRIIFSTMKKFDGDCIRYLTVPEIKQIAGRAGRYGSKYPFGEVTCLSLEDLPLLHSSLESPSPAVERAGLFPTYDLLSLYSRLNPKIGFRCVLEEFLEKAKLSPNYFITDYEEMLKVAAVIDDLPLMLQDKYLFCMSPVDMYDDIVVQGLVQFARSYAKAGIVRLKEIFTPERLRVPSSQSGLKELESVHKVLELYVWLSYRLEDSFPDRVLASSQKSLCSLLIEEFLERLGWQRPRQLQKKSCHSRSLPVDVSLGEGHQYLGAEPIYE